MKEIEELLGRQLKPIEIAVFNVYNSNSDYVAVKDKHGNLMYELK